jgi:putative ABC transport system permease protein
MRQDLRLAIRLLLKEPHYALAAVLTLALCIGANAAVFSIVRSVVLRPLPVPASDRIMLVYNSYPNAGAEHGEAGVPDYYDRLQGVPAFDEQALYERMDVTYSAPGVSAERIRGVMATPSFFRLTGARALAGRIFRESEGETGHDRVAVISEGFWRSHFGGDPDVVGRTVQLDGTTREIVGILPAQFRFLWRRVDVWMPAAFSAADRADSRRHSNNWNELGRLAPGATRAQAQQQVHAINATNDARFPQFHQILKDAGFHTVVVPLQQDVTRTIRPALYLLWGGVLFVLLIGCVNIANLTLVRAMGRGRELATRHAVGATLLRLSRQLLTESLVVTTIGGALGVALGFWALRAAPWLHLDDLPLGFAITMDADALLAMVGLIVVVALLVAVMPVLRLRRIDAAVILQEEGRSGTASRGARLIRSGLATAQVATACVLLTGAGLLAGSFRQVLRQDPGFDASGVMTAAIDLPDTRYDDRGAVSFTNRLLDGVRALPGVTAAGVTNSVPMGDEYNSSVLMPEGHALRPGDSLIAPNQVRASDGYFEAMGITIVRGRAFRASDTADAPPVVIVDERLAATYWPGLDPIGRRVYHPDNPNDLLKVGPDIRYLTVVGVAQNVALTGLAPRQASVGAYYYPLAQQSSHAIVLAVKTALPLDGLIAPIRRVVAGLDPLLPVASPESMAGRIDDSLVGRRVPMQLAMTFAAIALLLAALGIYGVLAYSVAERRRELSIRMALGCTRGGIFGLVIGDGLRVTVAGLVLGFAGALAAGRLMAAELFGVRPSDPTVLAVVAVTLGGVALLASAIPARRAARVDPRGAAN